MPGAKKNSIGLEGFIWFIGTVEDRDDPEKMGRVRVRCFGWHTENKSMISTDSLPWSHPVFPVNNPMTTYAPKEGDMVFGFFLDGDSAQNPVVVGVLPGKPLKRPDYSIGFSDPNKKYPKEDRINEATTSRLARGRKDGTIIETREKNRKKNIQSVGGEKWSEPAPEFAPKYPFNCAQETESGHAFELDDTEGKERVQLAHKSGTFVEMTSDGGKISKVMNDNYSLVMGDDFIYVSGKCNITIDGDCNMRVGGKFSLEANEINMVSLGDISAKAKDDVKMESENDFNIKSGAKIKAEGAGKTSISGSDTTIQGNKIDLAAAKVNLNSGEADSASESGLTYTEVTTETTEQASSLTQFAPVTGIIGKTVGSVTQTVSNLGSQLGSALSKISGGLAGGALGANIAGDLGMVSNMLLQHTGSIAGMSGSQRKEMLGQLGKVLESTFKDSVTRTISQEIANHVATNIAPEEFNPTRTQIGKQVYPSTRTVTYEQEYTTEEIIQKLASFAGR